MIPILLVAMAATGAVAAPGATTVSELVVDGGPAPKMATSFPADGAEVAAGVLVIKLVFDRSMTPDSWSYGRSPSGEFPSCLAKPRLLADGRTFVLLCTVAAHKTYAMEINLSPAFASQGGRLAKPSRLSFSTADTEVWAMHDALLQAGLTDADEPVMTWRDDGAGVSRSPPPGAP